MTTADSQPPAGMRWREETYTGLTGARYTASYRHGVWCERLQGVSITRRYRRFTALAVPDEAVARVFALRASPLEPARATVWSAVQEEVAAIAREPVVGEARIARCVDAILHAVAQNWRGLATWEHPEEAR